MKVIIKNNSGGLTLEFVVILPIIMIIIMLALNSVKYNMNASSVIKDTYQAGRFSTVYESCELAKNNLDVKFSNYDVYYKFKNYGNNSTAKNHNSTTQTRINNSIKNGNPTMIIECDFIWDREQELSITATKQNYVVGLDLIIPQHTAERITLYIEYEHPIYKQCEKYEATAKGEEDMTGDTGDKRTEYYLFLQEALQDINDTETTFDSTNYCK